MLRVPSMTSFPGKRRQSNKSMSFGVRFTVIASPVHPRQLTSCPPLGWTPPQVRAHGALRCFRLGPGTVPATGVRPSLNAQWRRKALLPYPDPACWFAPGGGDTAQRALWTSARESPLRRAFDSAEFCVPVVVFPVLQFPFSSILYQFHFSAESLHLVGSCPEHDSGIGTQGLRSVDDPRVSRPRTGCAVPFLCSFSTPLSDVCVGLCQGLPYPGASAEGTRAARGEHIVP